MGPDIFFLDNLVVVAVFMAALWVVSVIVHDASIVDPFWGMAFVVIVWSQYIRAFILVGQPACQTVDCATPWPPAAALLVPVLVTIWGVRLSAYLAWRNIGKGEDRRYVRMRERAGRRFPLISLFSVFLLQACLAWVVSLPAQAATTDLAIGAPLVLAGIGLWGIGLFFETVGDLQLTRFKRDPANQGQVMDRGLWRYTRHPNYFGDFCAWWGLFLIAASTGAWWTVIGPIVMSVLLIRVSGAGLLESTIKERRPGYTEYIQRTSGFFPRPPRG